MTVNARGKVRKKPYSTPMLTRTSLTALAERMHREASEEKALAAGAGGGPQPPTLVVEGCRGDVAALGRASSTLGWQSEVKVNSAGVAMLEIVPERTPRWFFRGSLTPEGVVALLRLVPEAMSRGIDFSRPAGAPAKKN